jgi:hypothetical protein
MTAGSQKRPFHFERGMLARSPEQRLRQLPHVNAAHERMRSETESSD